MKTKRPIQINKDCRVCLGNPGTQDIFTTKIKMYMQHCFNIELDESDCLPTKICVTCFRLISKFHLFKRRMEKNDKILRNFLKLNKNKQFFDILHKAVNDAQIEEMSSNIISEDVIIKKDDNNCNTSTTSIDNKNLDNSFTRITDDIIMFNEPIIDNTTSQRRLISGLRNVNNSKEIDRQKCQIKLISVDEVNPAKSTVLPQIFDEPPPLVPLQPISSIISSTTQNVASTDIPATTSMPTLEASKEKNVEEKGFKIACNICDEEFQTIFALKEHRLANCQNNLMKCNICKKEFKERKRLIGHLKGHMVIKEHGCKICGKQYPSPSTLRVHVRTHTGERPFKCNICGKGFVRQAGVVGHLKTHNVAKPHICETCGRGFKISSNLERHKILHTGILPYCCNFCGKTFCQSDNLQLHIKTYHTHEKHFLCNVCGKSFVNSTRLRRHMWVHTGYKPYTCSKCPKAYSNLNDLKNHERLHSGATVDKDGQKFECNFCNMKFSQQCRLSRHLKTHNKEFSCMHCNMRFRTNELYSKHLDSIHNNTQKDINEPDSLPIDDVFFTLE